ncbi:hypothetical protein GGTG_04002 [Gaeumannomyces tritici R3-111a-1]|uniref:Cell cycle inhibitor Nif1 n=1 Tax=Gaeumannomyces tritici (strain R3-111a-1) TaxID=644352 RepID=J3NRV3_GAET3|nr:hypothetical protein GGTG_04002 [Gaeumannomyces tritici R3-111a-1]EJT78909.1 hypothetical protein GGTG_04002 [Gaeumannomyces tritici R3-111a-1]
MATPRPGLLDLRTQSQASVSRPLRSPRLHVAGEAPPELSPLDAFALHSRMLARQLEESAKAGRRMSRLPPLTTESPLVVQGRSDYFRSMSQDSLSDHADSPQPLSAPGLGNKAEVEELPNRPVSMHPRMSRIPATPDAPLPFIPPNPFLDLNRGRVPERIEENDGLFGARTERSPSPMSSIAGSEKTPEPVSPQRRPTSGAGQTQTQGQLLENIKASSFDLHGLAPPRAHLPSRSPSTMSTPTESSYGEGWRSSMSNSHPSNNMRKLSASSGTGFHSPAANSYQRSPSISSDMSGPLPKPSFNFSRPLSRASTPGFDLPNRQLSSDSQGSFVLVDENVNTPISISSEMFPDTLGDGERAAPSYIYSKYALPRGKMLQRSSQFADQQTQGLAADQVAAAPHDSQAIGQAPPSPPTRPSSSTGSHSRPSLERSKLSKEVLGAAVQSSPSAKGRRASEDSGAGPSKMSPHAGGVRRARTAGSTTTSESASTLRPARSMHSLASAAEIPAEEHVAKAIELHQQGSLSESTYHLRHAARQGHPTGMLLFALACRHGWGMRANPREGVEWLRKAADYAGLEVADDEGQAKEGKRVDFLENKTRKAQFALSIYELGVSHMNGWGIEQDKALALRCFEIAGNWGDVDALAEAGFCYAQGVGCKKDLKKSAHFYRMAEAKGMSMVGNSWIHKSKYDDSAETSSSPKSDKKSRSKSRTRGGLFSRRHKDKDAAES